MKITFFLFTLVWLTVLGSFSQTSHIPVSLNEREGIPHFLKKVKSGRAVTVAYLGGSITKADGWRVKNQQWMSAHFRNDSIKGINAGIGGTGSELGVFRVEQDVITHQPDLVFVEFAVNDGNPKNDLSIRKAMEGIVRKIWKALPDTDICFVYTLKEEFLAELQLGLFPKASSAHEMVADHYGIPSVHFGFQVAEKVRKGDIIFSQKTEVDSLGYSKEGKLVFSKDGVHPTLSGHELYHKELKKAIRSMEALSGRSSRVLPAPALEDNYEDARVITVASIKNNGMRLITADSDPDYFQGEQKFFQRFDTLILGSAPLNSLSFQMKGKQMGIWEVKGPKRGDMLITIDGGSPLTYYQKKIKGFDKYSSKWRESYKLLPPLPEHTYTVTIQVHPSIPEKDKILQSNPNPKHFKQFEEHPAYFQGTDMVIGRILIRGEMVSVSK